MEINVIKFRVLIEGVLVPLAHSVSINSDMSGMARGSISLPPVPGFETEELKRAHVQIYWSDVEIRSAVSDCQWPMLFEGEITGDSFSKAPDSRDQTYTCTGVSTYLDQARLYYLDAGHSNSVQALNVPSMTAALGVKNFKFDVGSSSVAQTDLLAAKMAEAIKSGKYYDGIAKIIDETMGVNYFFRLSNRRLKLKSRFSAVSGNGLGKLLTKSLIEKAVVSDMSAMSGETSVINVIKRVLSIFRYHIVVNSQPIIDDDGFLTQFMLLPDTRFSAIPECNVLAPNKTSTVSISREFMAEPTRAIGMPYTNLNMQHVVIVAPEEVANNLRIQPPGAEAMAVADSEFGYHQPLPDYRVTSPFGMRVPPVAKKEGKKKNVSETEKKMHNGIDLGKPGRSSQVGTPVFAVASGLVTKSGFQDPGDYKKGYGYRIYIRHDDDGMTSLYAHLDESGNTAAGSRVEAGERIGYIGTTGSATGPHLHFGVQNSGGAWINPVTILGIKNKKGARAPTMSWVADSEESTTSSETEPITQGGKFNDYTYLTPEENLVGIVPMFDHETAQSNELVTGFKDDVERKKYYQQLITAEFYERRVSARSLSPFSVPFSPNAVAGFPGLILDKDRSIIAYIVSVSHSLSMRGGGSAYTTITCQSPRFWNEGDPYYWRDGVKTVDDQNIPNKSAAAFPAYYPTSMVMENNADIGHYLSDKRSAIEKSEDRDADVEFTRMLGVKSIDYANASRKTTMGTMVNYNAAIDGGPNTIMGRYKSALKSGAEVAANMIKKMTERRGLTEEEFMNFLGCSTSNGGVTYTGPTFRKIYQDKVMEMNKILNAGHGVKG